MASEKASLAGCFNSEAYELSWYKMQHAPLISLETFEKIQERRKRGAKAPIRVNAGDQFALRGIAVRACCNAPFRSSFSKSRNGTRHLCYSCKSKSCEFFGKSIRREVLEEEVGTMIRQLEPTTGLVDLVTAMFRKAQNCARHRRRIFRARSVSKSPDQNRILPKRLIGFWQPSRTRCIEHWRIGLRGWNAKKLHLPNGRDSVQTCAYL